MEQGNLYFTIGLPRSGKSTECKKWLNYESEILHPKTSRVGVFHSMCHFTPGRPRIVVTPDHWRLALGHRYNWFVEPVVFSHVQIAVKALLHNYDVVVDDTHTTAESVKRIYECHEDAVAIPIPTSPEICKERAIKTGQPDLAKIIDRMAINMAISYGIRLEHIEETLINIRSSVIAHSSKKVVV